MGWRCEGTSLANWWGFRVGEVLDSGSDLAYGQGGGTVGSASVEVIHICPHSDVEETFGYQKVIQFGSRVVPHETSGRTGSHNHGPCFGWEPNGFQDGWFFVPVPSDYKEVLVF